MSDKSDDKIDLIGKVRAGIELNDDEREIVVFALREMASRQANEGAEVSSLMEHL